jgi:hypothetical protein
VRETIAAITNPELIERVRELRQRGRRPKEIARALGMPPAAAAPLRPGVSGIGDRLVELASSDRR